MGMIYLVGAGPGAAGLITVAGIEKLKQCDAVIYDRLASEELLKYIKQDCEKIYVGKSPGQHYKKQEEINEILVEYARKKNMVVRLKGGDSFVFGRGGEEIETLQKHGIPFEVIPGVTSAVAVPECAGIPVTHRGASRSFHVFTGHTATSAGTPEYDYKNLAGMEGTLVFLMGLSNLSKITESLTKAGKATDTPVAVISEGTTAFQQVVRGMLSDIANKVKEQNMRSPAIIVIGETADYEFKHSRGTRKKVGITATGLLWKKLADGFTELNMQPVLLCNMQVVQTEQIQKLEVELTRLNKYQWVVFTSQNAVQIFFDEMKQKKIDIRGLGNIKFAVLGSGTAEKLSSYGIQADFIPSEYTVPILAKELANRIKPEESVLIPRAVQSNRSLVDILLQKGIACCDIPIYDVVGTMTENIELLEELDYLVFVSASGVTAFFEELRKQKRTLPKGLKIACIGNVTKQRLQQEYGEADIVAAVNDVEGMLEAVRLNYVVK